MIELLMALGVIGILTLIALPSYSAYARRERLSEGPASLSELQVRMESYYQNTTSYGTGTTCGITPGTYSNFTITCLGTNVNGTTNLAQGYLLTASGTGTISGTSYTLDDQGNKQTNGSGSCWLVTGNEC